jgi:Trehalose utilisation
MRAKPIRCGALAAGTVVLGVLGVACGPFQAQPADALSASPPCATPCSGVCDRGTCKTCTSTAGCSADAPVCEPDANRGFGSCTQVEILAFELPDAQMTDRAHAAYQRHANAWFPQAGRDQKFFTFTVTNDWNRLKTIKPRKGLIVMFVDISPTDPDEQAGFRSYVEHGGAWFGSHFSGYNDDTSPGEWTWRWYFDDFLGGSYYVNNTWQPVSINLHVEDPSHPVSQGLGTMFRSAPSEWYAWKRDLRTLPNIKILLSVDPSSFPVGTDPTQTWYGGYYPVAWTNTNYKMLYVNMGHELMNDPTDTGHDAVKAEGPPLSSAFSSPTQNILYTNAFRWLGGAI